MSPPQWDIGPSLLLQPHFVIQADNNGVGLFLHTIAVF